MQIIIPHYLHIIPHHNTQIATPDMPNISNILTNVYLLTTYCLFGYTVYTKYNETDNYFAAALQLIDSPFYKLLLYNLVIATAVVVYKITIFLFYQEVKENQTLNLVQKIGFKLFQLFYFLYMAGSGFGIQAFVSLTFVFMMFIFHNIAIARASFLIHTHVSEHMTMNYRLLAHFIVMIFIDYELSVHTFSWLFSESDEPSLIIFAYYCITLSLSIIEPALSFFLHFYEAYTNCPIQNSDINMMRLKFIINVPRLIFQILLSILLVYQFTLSFLLIFALIESVNEIMKTLKAYNNMKGLIDKMKNLRQLGPQELQKEHDRVCTVCFAEINNSALFLPCKHIFHKQCLRQWIIKNSNHHCPKCKKPFDFQNMKSSKLEEQIRKAKQEIRQKNAEDQRVDPLGFARDIRNARYLQKQKTRPSFNQNQYQHSRNQQSMQHLQRQVLKLDQNNLLSKLQATKQKVKRYRREQENIGSVPYGLPTEAVYSRRERDMKARQRIIWVNEKMIRFMKMEPAKQLLFVPEFQ